MKDFGSESLGRRTGDNYILSIICFLLKLSSFYERAPLNLRICIFVF